MIKRSLATMAVAGIVLAVPAAAFADTYVAPDHALTCSPTQVAPNGTITCTVKGAPTDTATLTTTTSGDDATIDGTVTSGSKPVGTSGAVFTVTAPSQEGTIGISATINGQTPTNTASVEVAAELSGTGFDGMPLAVGAGVLLVAGAAVVFVAARRRANA